MKLKGIAVADVTIDPKTGKIKPVKKRRRQSVSQHMAERKSKKI